MSEQEYFGVYNINKPSGWSSRDVVNRIVRMVKPVKAGHAGTLDPLATGVLVVCVGPATRLISRVQAQPKTYVAEFTLGSTSPTDDKEGEVTVAHETVGLSLEAIESALQKQVGKIQQRPPAFSAVHVNGQRAYKLARKGNDVEIPPREVEVYRITILHYVDPVLTVEIECGSGTYIRSIARDLGEALECGGLMSGLERTAIGQFKIEDAVGPMDINRCNFPDRLQPARGLVADLPYYICQQADVDALRSGRSIPLSTPPVTSSSTPPAETQIAIIDPDGLLLALAEQKDDTLQPRQVFRKGH